MLTLSQTKKHYPSPTKSKIMDGVFRAILINSYILILDDLGAIHSTDWRKEVAFDIIDKRYKDILPTVITTNIFPSDLDGYYGKRVADRILSDGNTIIILNNIKSRR